MEASAKVLEPFVDENNEDNQSECPVLGSAHCNWLGSDILTHCRDQHLDSVLESPCSLVHDITRSSQQNYILRAFQQLFLLHTKINVATGKIIHSVRFLGPSEEAANIYFILDIKRNNVLVSKEGQEDTPVSVNTSSLLDMLGGFDGTTFTVTVKRRVSDAVDQLASRVERVTRDVVTCAGCGAEVTVFRYRKEDGWRCERCAPAMRACENLDCPYKDTDIKCRKHELLFCQQGIRCDLCQTNVLRGMLSAHYGSEHQDITCRAGSTWRATRTRGGYQMVSSVAGNAVCRYTLDNKHFVLYVSIPVTSERLREFRCEVKVTHPTTGHTQTYTPDAEYDARRDWYIRVDRRKVSNWSRKFDVVVNIKEIQ